ncbi:carbon-nitrogen hydrolase family protein [Nonomuraea muscovyensis]
MTEGRAVRILLVRPSHWSPDGHANFDAVEAACAARPPRTGRDDVVLLPELVGGRLSRPDYLARLRALAAGTGSTVVGGSHYDETGAATVNRGAVVDPAGTLLAEYGKRHPYGVEHRAGVRPGSAGDGFEVGGRRLHVLICADLWYSADLVRRRAAPIDVLLVPAFSVTQWPAPDPARLLWRHMSVARAYEFMMYVAVSDWHHEAAYDGQRCAGVTGVADPCPSVPGDYFTAGPQAPLWVRDLDFDRLDAFRADRTRRGFTHDRPP